MLDERIKIATETGFWYKFPYKKGEKTVEYRHVLEYELLVDVYRNKIVVPNVDDDCEKMFTLDIFSLNDYGELWSCKLFDLIEKDNDASVQAYMREVCRICPNKKGCKKEKETKRDCFYKCGHLVEEENF